MLQVSITGGIGSGKTTVAKLLECLGFSVYYADERGRWLSDNDPQILAAIKMAFGEAVFLNNGLNRLALAAKVFGEKELLQQLNEIIHPRVRADYAKWLGEQKQKIVFSEIAILFEHNRQHDFDYNVLVTAPEEIRIARVMQRSKLTREEVSLRISRQMSEAEKQKLANAVIVNDNITALIPQLDILIKTLLINN